MHILRNIESEILHLCTFHIHLMSKTLTENIFPKSTEVHQIDMNWSEGSVPIAQCWLNNCNYYTVGGDSWNFSLHPRLLLFTSASSHSHSALSYVASLAANPKTENLVNKTKCLSVSWCFFFNSIKIFWFVLNPEPCSLLCYSCSCLCTCQHVYCYEN